MNSLKLLFLFLAVSGSSVFAYSPGEDKSDSTRIVLRSSAEALAENLQTLKHAFPGLSEYENLLKLYTPEHQADKNNFNTPGSALKMLPPRDKMPIVHPRDHHPMLIHVPDSSVHHTILIK